MNDDGLPTQEIPERREPRRFAAFFQIAAPIILIAMIVWVAYLSVRFSHEVQKRRIETCQQLDKSNTDQLDDLVRQYTHDGKDPLSPEATNYLKAQRQAFDAAFQNCMKAAK